MYGIERHIDISLEWRKKDTPLLDLPADSPTQVGQIFG